MIVETNRASDGKTDIVAVNVAGCIIKPTEKWTTHPSDYFIHTADHVSRAMDAVRKIIEDSGFELDPPEWYLITSLINCELFDELWIWK